MGLLKKYAKDALSALAYIHSQGVIHCDIKLSNMGLHKESEEDEETLKLFDFSLSVYADSEIEGKAHLEKSVGTFGYMAPELQGVSSFLLGLSLTSYFREIFTSVLRLTCGH